jgi:hypothetical protein
LLQYCPVMRSWDLWCEVHLGYIVRLMNVLIAPDLPYLIVEKSCKPYHLQGKTARCIKSAFDCRNKHLDRTASFGSAINYCTMPRYCIGPHIQTVESYDVLRVESSMWSYQGRRRGRDGAKCWSVCRDSVERHCSWQTSKPVRAKTVKQ